MQMRCFEAYPTLTNPTFGAGLTANCTGVVDFINVSIRDIAASLFCVTASFRCYSWRDDMQFDPSNTHYPLCCGS
jgi:hypothetical protein